MSSGDRDPVGHLFGELGEKKIRQFVAEFYRRVRNDDLLGRMYPPGDWQGAEDRLHSFLVQRFGGPELYSASRGHPRLRLRHMSFAIGDAEKDRWLELMENSLRKVGVSEFQRSSIMRFFTEVAKAMVNT